LQNKNGYFDLPDGRHGKAQPECRPLRNTDGVCGVRGTHFAIKVEESLPEAFQLKKN